MTQSNFLSSPGLPATANLQPVTANVIRSIKWPCNYNNKMGCTGFIHIDLAPEQKPLYSQLDTMMVRIVTADNSHPPVVVHLFDMLFLPLKQIPGGFTLPSHGMELMEFATYMIKKYPERVTLDTELAVYYYKKA